MFFAVDAETPVAHAEHQARVDQQARVALEVLLQAAAPETRALGHDLDACAAAEARCGQHVLPSRHGLLQDLGVDLLIEAIV